MATAFSHIKSTKSRRNLLCSSCYAHALRHFRRPHRTSASVLSSVLPGLCSSAGPRLGPEIVERLSSCHDLGVQLAHVLFTQSGLGRWSIWFWHGVPRRPPHRERPAAQLAPVQRLDRGLGVCAPREVDEGEPSRLSRVRPVLVVQISLRVDLAEAREELDDVRLGHPPRALRRERGRSERGRARGFRAACRTRLPTNRVVPAEVDAVLTVRPVTSAAGTELSTARRCAPGSSATSATARRCAAGSPGESSAGRFIGPKLPQLFRILCGE